MGLSPQVRDAFERAVREWEPLWQKAYDEGVSRKGLLADVSLKECLARTASRFGGEPCVVADGEVWTFDRMNDCACRIANALAARGLRKGDAVVAALEDSPWLMALFMACYKGGFAVVGMDGRSTACELAERLAGCNARALAVDEAHAEAARKALGEARAEAFGIVALSGAAADAGESGSAFVSAFPLREDEVSLQELAAFPDGSEPAEDVGPDDIAVIIFTGGTTGASKGCPLTHAMLVQAQAFFQQILQPLFPGFAFPLVPAAETSRFAGAGAEGGAKPPSILVTSPMVHAYGLDLGVNWAVCAGGAVVLPASLTAKDVVHAVAAYRPALWGSVPAMLGRVTREAEAEGCDLSSLEAVVVSCCATPQELRRDFAKLSHARIVEDYGMTETSGPVALTPALKGTSEGATGLPTPDTDMLVVDIETGTRPCGPGERGEIVFRGPQIIREYWNAPAETAKALRDGWLYSGDVGYFDETGALFVVDRIKDVVLVGGFSVFPREIDEVLYTHPDVVEACTIGVADERSGERPKSFVVLREGARTTEQDLIDFCHERLTAYKCPKYVEFTDAIPKTFLAKQDKKELRRREEARRAAAVG